MTATPPFLLWALEFACPLRQIDQWTDPERTERHLRAAREAGAGIQAGRVIDGICLGPECFAEQPPDKPTGFDVAAALALYGGEAAVRSACQGCPANGAAGFAGCFDLVVLSSPPGELAAAVASSPIVGDSARQFASLFGLLPALQVAAEENLPLHLRRFPAGRIAGRRWILPPHCARCGAERPTSAACPECGSEQPPIGERRRHVRGPRPYFDLQRLVGPDRAADLLARARKQLPQ